MELFTECELMLMSPPGADLGIPLEELILQASDFAEALTDTLQNLEIATLGELVKELIDLVVRIGSTLRGGHETVYNRALELVNACGDAATAGAALQDNPDDQGHATRYNDLNLSIPLLFQQLMSSCRDAQAQLGTFVHIHRDIPAERDLDSVLAELQEPINTSGHNNSNAISAPTSSHGGSGSSSGSSSSSAPRIRESTTLELDGLIDELSFVASPAPAPAPIPASAVVHVHVPAAAPPPAAVVTASYSASPLPPSPREFGSFGEKTAEQLEEERLERALNRRGVPVRPNSGRGGVAVTVKTAAAPAAAHNVAPAGVPAWKQRQLDDERRAAESKQSQQAHHGGGVAAASHTEVPQWKQQLQAREAAEAEAKRRALEEKKTKIATVGSIETSAPAKSTAPKTIAQSLYSGGGSSGGFTSAASSNAAPRAASAAPSATKSLYSSSPVAAAPPPPASVPVAAPISHQPPPVINQVPSDLPVCAGCSKPIGEGTYCRAGEKNYHTSCFLCHRCRQEFPKGQYHPHSGQFLCPTCYMEAVVPQIPCVACNQRILGAYLTTARGTYHHDCFVCARCKIKVTGSYVEVGDTHLCVQCANADAESQ